MDACSIQNDSIPLAHQWHIVMDAAENTLKVSGVWQLLAVFYGPDSAKLYRYSSLATHTMQFANVAYCYAHCYACTTIVHILTSVQSLSML